ncbi:MAG: type II secretion system inner membrane protein GspF, partial [Thiomonas delicata]
MPAYRFVALDATAAETRGVLEADSARGARGMLRARGLIPLEVDAIVAEHAPGQARRFTRRLLNAQQIALLTRQIAGLLVSGLPLERALAALADDADR